MKVDIVKEMNFFLGTNNNFGTQSQSTVDDEKQNSIYCLLNPIY